MAATLLGEAAILLPVLDGGNHQETSATCCCQQVLYDTADKGDVLCGLVQLYQAVEIETVVDGHSGKKDHEQFHDVLLLMIELTRSLI